MIDGQVSLMSVLTADSRSTPVCPLRNRLFVMAKMARLFSGFISVVFWVTWQIANHGQHPIADEFRLCFIMAKTIKHGVDNARRSPVVTSSSSDDLFHAVYLTVRKKHCVFRPHDNPWGRHSFHPEKQGNPQYEAFDYISPRDLLFEVLPA